MVILILLLISTCQSFNEHFSPTTATSLASNGEYSIHDNKQLSSSNVDVAEYFSADEKAERVVRSAEPPPAAEACASDSDIIVSILKQYNKNKVGSFLIMHVIMVMFVFLTTGSWQWCLCDRRSVGSRSNYYF